MRDLSKILKSIIHQSSFFSSAQSSSPYHEKEENWCSKKPRGIAIPQHIIIPPTKATIGPDGRIQPQTYQINSEIRISYDQYGRPKAPVTTVERSAIPFASPSQSVLNHRNQQAVSDLFEKKRILFFQRN